MASISYWSSPSKSKLESTRAQLNIKKKFKLTSPVHENIYHESGYLSKPSVPSMADKRHNKTVFEIYRSGKKCHKRKWRVQRDSDSVSTSECRICGLLYIWRNQQWGKRSIPHFLRRPERCFSPVKEGNCTWYKDAYKLLEHWDFPEGVRQRISDG